MKMIALTSHGYAGRDLRPGDVYEVDEPYLFVMELMGNCRPADPDAMIPEILTEVLVVAEVKPKHKNQYSRKDLRAEV